MGILRARLAMFALLAGALLCSSARGQDEVKLRYKHKDGQKLPYVLDSKSTMEMSVMGNDVKIETSQVIDTTLAVKSVDKDGKAEMMQTIDRIRFTMDSPFGKFEFDSKDGKLPDDMIGQMIGPIFKAMAGAEITMKIDARGNVSDFKLGEKSAEALKKIPMIPGFGGMLSEESLKALMRDNFMVTPEDAIAKGKSWTTKSESKDQTGKRLLEIKYTFEGMETRSDKKVAKIGIKPNLTLEADPSAPAAMKLKSQTGKGAAFFDNEAGRLLENSTSQDMEMELNFMGNSITQKVKAVTTLKVADK